MEIELQVDRRLANGFELENYQEIFVPSIDLTQFGKWFIKSQTPIYTGHDAMSSKWSYRLFLTTVN